MRNYIWRSIVIVAFLAMHIWVRSLVSEVREECRIGREQRSILAERIARMEDNLPAMLRYELARNRQCLIDWMVAHNDCKGR